MDLDCSAQFQLLWERFKVTDKCKLMMLQNSTGVTSVYSSVRTFFYILVNVCTPLEMELVLQFLTCVLPPH